MQGFGGGWGISVPVNTGISSDLEEPDNLSFQEN